MRCGILRLAIGLIILINSTGEGFPAAPSGEAAWVRTFVLTEALARSQVIAAPAGWFLSTVYGASAASTKESAATVRLWLDLAQRELSRYEDTVFAVRFISQLADYLTGFEEIYKFVFALEKDYRADVLSYPLPKEAELRAIGNGLREEWRAQGWEDSAGHLNQYLAFTGGYVAPSDLLEMNRKSALIAEGNLEDQTITFWAKAVNLAGHIASIGPHDEMRGGFPSDFPLLIQFTRRYIPLMMAWSAAELDRSIPRSRNFSGSVPKATYRDVLFWGLTAMVNPVLYDVQHTEEKDMMPIPLDETVPQALLAIFKNLECVDGQGHLVRDSAGRSHLIYAREIERLLAEVFRRSPAAWTERGFRSPWELAGLSLDPEKIAGAGIPRPWRDPIFMYPFLPQSFSLVWQARMTQEENLALRWQPRYHADPAGFAASIFLGPSPLGTSLRGMFPNMAQYVGEANPSWTGAPQPANEAPSGSRSLKTSS